MCGCVYKQDLALNNPRGLICHKTQPYHFHRPCMVYSIYCFKVSTHLRTDQAFHCLTLVM